MREIRYAEQSDSGYWFTLDAHLDRAEFDRKVRDRRCYILTVDGEPAGIMRYNLFWDSVPFCTLLYIDPAQQGKGYGRQMMEHWEREMKALGHGMALTSTQVDEKAQHFYRALGYRDCGGLVPDVPGYEQPMELFMLKEL